MVEAGFSFAEDRPQYLVPQYTNVGRGDQHLRDPGLGVLESTAGAISFSAYLIILYCFRFIYEIVLQLLWTYTGGMVEVNVQRLRALRQQRVLTLRELEERSGVAYNTIWHLENGKRGAQPRTLRKLADALGVDPGELVKVEGGNA